MIQTPTTSWAGFGRGKFNENSARIGFCLRMRSSRRWRSCHDSSKGRTSGAYPQESMRTDIYLIPGPGRPSALSALAPRGTVMFNNHVCKHKSNFFVHEHELDEFPFMFDNHVVEHEMIGYRSCSRTCHVREHESRVGVVILLSIYEAPRAQGSTGEVGGPRARGKKSSTGEHRGAHCTVYGHAGTRHGACICACAV